MMKISLLGLSVSLLIAVEHVALAAESSPAGASIVSVNGKVTVSEKDVAPGDEVPLGATIATRAKSTAKLIMPDNSIVDLGPSTTFKVEEVTKDADGVVVAARVDLGTVRASIQKKYDKKEKFFIRTKASVLAVRGTEFLVTVSQNNTRLNERVVVSDGVVALRPINGPMNVEPIALGAGKSFSQEGSFQGDKFVTSGGFKVADVTQVQVKEIMTTNTVEDKTFTQVVTVSEAAVATSTGSPTAQGKETLAQVASNFTPPPPPKEGAPLPGGRLNDFRPPPVKGIDLNYVNELNPTLVQPTFVNVTVTFTP